jgi:hypothetical protein
MSASPAGPVIVNQSVQRALRVNEAKLALGERGPVWWENGAPDYNRHMARNTCYADWFARRD